MQAVSSSSGNLMLLQVVRCFAALVVVWHHTGSAPKFGVAGVDLFFVLSGCIMSMLMMRGPTPSEFLRRRLIRIVPMYLLATLALLLAFLIAPSIRRTGLTLSWNEILQSLLFLPYENSRGELSPFLSVGWTLNFEIAFYLCCTAGLFLSRKFSTALAAILAISLFGVAHFFPKSATGRFFSDPLIFEFIAGMLIYKFWLVTRSRGYVFTITVGSLGLISLIALPFAEQLIVGSISPGVQSYERPLYLLPFAAVVVYAALVLEPYTRNLGQRWLSLGVRIGDASYAIYLTHMFVLTSISKFSNAVWGKELAWPPVALASVLIATLIGIVIHEYIDAPLQKLLRRRTLARTNTK
jgi:exopolysaccharide production protein ExoZ